MSTHNEAPEHYRKPHVFDPIHNGADECECGLVESADIHESDQAYEARMRPRIVNAPLRIWLQAGCDDEVGEINWKELSHSDVSWCAERIYNTDIEYARVDPPAAPTGRPCSACGDGDTALEYHNHDHWNKSPAPDEADKALAQQDHDVICELFKEWGGSDTMGVLRCKMIAYAATVRAEAREVGWTEAIEAAQNAQIRVGASRNCYDSPDEAEGVAKYMIERIESARTGEVE